MSASHGDRAPSPGTPPKTPSVLRRAFPDHWSSLLGELALYSFAVVLLTGAYLTLFFVPSLEQVTYDGSYGPLQGVRMSEAYASTLHIGFDVRGGSLIRQTHHWAAVIFTLAIIAHLMRTFFTGAFRRTRGLTWLIGIALLMLVMLNGLIGHSLPDDLRSGTGLRVLEGALASIPLIGSYLATLLSGGEYVPRLYLIHILLIPALLLALITLHAVAHPLERTRPPRVPTRSPGLVRRAAGLFLGVLGVTALLATAVKLNPVWLFGPYQPGRISAESQPYPYAGWLDGPLRLMPGWELTAGGHTLSLNVLVPALLVPGLLFAGLAVYPSLERRFIADDLHAAPARIATGTAAIAFYATLWAAGAHDTVTETFGVPLFWTTWFFRVAIIYVPLLTFALAYLTASVHERRNHPVPRLASGPVALRQRA